jgi:hypothetical protein
MHTRAPDIDELGAFGEQPPERFCILGVQCIRERLDEVPGLVKTGYRYRLTKVHASLLYPSGPIG